MELNSDMMRLDLSNLMKKERKKRRKKERTKEKRQM